MSRDSGRSSAAFGAKIAVWQKIAVWHKAIGIAHRGGKSDNRADDRTEGLNGRREM